MRWLKVLLAILILGGAALPSAAQASDAPYLYFFDNRANGFVIKRADGSDVRHIGAEVTQESWVDWSAWSPSGDWLAWHSNGFVGCGGQNVIEGGYVASADQAYALGTFEKVRMAWSPEQDWLLMSGENSLENEAVNLNWQVIAPGSDAPLASGEYTGVTESSPRLIWFGNKAIIYFTTEAKTLFYGLDMDNDGAESVIEIAGQVISLSPDGNVAYRSGESLIVENIFTGEIDQFPINIDDWLYIDWHGDQVVVLSEQAAWWLDLASDQAALIHETSEDVFDYPDPDRQTWGSGDVGIVADTEDMLYLVSPQGIEPLNQSGAAWEWLDDQRVAIYDRDTVEDDFMIIYNVATDMQESVTPMPENYFSSHPLFSPDEQYIAHVNDGAVITEAESGTGHYFIPNPLGYAGNFGGRVEWHPTQNWLISVEEGPAGCGGTYYTTLVSPEHGAYPQIECSSDYDCAEWLPEQVDPALYPTFERPVIGIEPIMVLEGEMWIDALTWEGDQISAYQVWMSTHAPMAWNATTGEQIAEVAPLPDEGETEIFNEVNVIAKSENGARLVGLDGWVYDTASGEGLYKLGEEASRAISAGYLRFSPDGKYLVGAGGAEPLQLWDADNGNLLFEGFYPTEAVFSPDSTQIAIAQSWNVYIYQVDQLR